MLLPRLARFRARQPGIELCIHASRDLAQFGRDEVDAAIRYAPVPSGNQYYFVCPKAGLRRPEVRALRDFLVREPARRSAPSTRPSQQALAPPNERA